MRAPLKLMRQACIAETKASETDIAACKNGNLVDTPELRCYILCLFEHSGMIEEDGTIHFKEVLHLMTPTMRETAEFVVRECETIRKTL